MYASTALERGPLKIKSIQITWLPVGAGEEQRKRKLRNTWQQ
ncbi:DUF1454 family protein [Shigella flexneri]